MQAADEGAIYTGGAGDVLPIDVAAARATVRSYVADNRLPARFPGFAVRSVEADGRSVTVTLLSRVRVPFVAVLGTDYVAGGPGSRPLRHHALTAPLRRPCPM